jgi:hypothetical protein
MEGELDHFVDAPVNDNHNKTLDHEKTGGKNELPPVKIIK